MYCASASSPCDCSRMVSFLLRLMLDPRWFWHSRQSYLLMLDSIGPSSLVSSALRDCEKRSESLLEWRLCSGGQSWKVSNSVNPPSPTMRSDLEKVLRTCFIIQRMRVYIILMSFIKDPRNATHAAEAEIAGKLKEIAFGEDFVAEIITKQFINSLKLEISQKVKPSKSILQALKHSNTINQTYKRQIQELSSRVQFLSSQNQRLGLKVESLEAVLLEKDEIHNSLLYSASLQREHSQHAEQQQHRDSQQAAHELQIEIELLKEKVRHLEEYRTLKEARFAEIIEREAQHVGEINLLRYRNETLEATVKALETSLQACRAKPERTSLEERLTRKRSEASEGFKSYINQEDSFKSEESMQDVREIQHLIIPRENVCLLQSCTRAVDIEQPYALDSVEKGKVEGKGENRSFNEIDMMLGEEVPNYRTSSLIAESEKEAPVNLNDSLIAININGAPL